MSPIPRLRPGASGVLLTCVAAVVAAGVQPLAGEAVGPARAAGGGTTAPAKPFKLVDKTLVAWVRLADTAQRAGSVLTLIDPEERFDAVVFAEVHPARWMAGSDFFHRTPREQGGWPAEASPVGTLVQVAVAYRGQDVAIYRDGKPYAAYKIRQPQEFGPETSVLLGLRYVGGMGEIGFLKCSIEEARLYGEALDAAAVAALKLNAPSAPPPLACWTFEDGTAADTMKTFPPAELRGGARIAGGQLHLDGRTAYAVAALPAPPPQPQAMFFQGRRLGGQWDTWLYYHQGTYYLFILAGPGGRWNGIAMARSGDGVHWEDLGLVLRKADGVTWLGTGSTWKSPGHEKDGKFQLNFSEWRGDRQTIFFAESADLVRWTRLGGELEFKQDARWYKPAGRWDCIYTIPRPGGGLYGYWTADPKSGPGVGFGQSLDGVRWEALPPPAFLDGSPHGECGAVEKIGERYYMMLGAGGRMVTLLAERPEGPFRPARKNLVLLAGQTYFARFFPTPQGLLVNHHSNCPQGTFFAPLKAAVVDAEGTLRLTYWPGNDKLKHEAVAVQMPARAGGAAGGGGLAMLGNTFDAEGGLILEGVLEVPKAGDGPGSTAPVGVYLDRGQAEGSAILVGAGGATEMGTIRPDGTAFVRKDRVDRELGLGGSVRFRLLLKRSLVEFYLDDHLMQCWSLPQSATGRVGLVCPAAFHDLRAWR